MNEIVLSEQQKTAIGKIETWFKNSKERIFVLHGYAGTGKTTIAKYAAEELVPTHEVAFLAYTGKAASVLRNKGAYNATTIHQAIYIPSGNPDPKLREMVDEMVALETPAKRKEELRLAIANQRALKTNGLGWRLNYETPVKDYKLIVIDECSMVDGKLMDDLLEVTKAKILMLGDPGQLPPVRGNPYEQNPNIFLEEIHRQAKENPLLEVATKVRRGEFLRPLKLSNSFGSITVADKIPPQDWLDADQIIVARNLTRQKINTRMREVLHQQKEDCDPILNEKVIILRNDHSLGIFNGMIGKLDSEPSPVDNAFGPPRFISDFKTDYGQIVPALDFSTLGFGQSDMGDVVDREHVLADYGYAITCHKSQGSEWKNICVKVERGKFDYKKWLYTAITRASENCKIALN